MRKFLLICLLFSGLKPLWSQVENTGMTDERDSLELGKLLISGLVDAYYSNDLNPIGYTDRPYASSSARVLEFTINMAYIEMDYKTEKARARFVPGFGTYINTNNAQEPGSLKNILEANVGLKISKKKEAWIDVGIFGAPYTNETAISKNQTLYTRSLSAEYSPYYLSGVRVLYPVGSKTNIYLYLVNGWQQMADRNKPMSVATQVEYRPTKKTLLNWSTYIGSEHTTQTPTYRNRYFNDLYFIYQPNTKWNLSTDFYYGLQEKHDSISNKVITDPWWQINVMGKYYVNPRFFISGRVEYFEDLKETIITALTSANSFNAMSGSLGLNYKASRNSLLRFEGRRYLSKYDVFPTTQGHERKAYGFLSTSLVVWF